MQKDKIKEIFDIQKQFTKKYFQERHNLDIDNLSNTDKLNWSKEFILCASKEIFEMLDEIPSWKKHRILKQENNIDNFLEEGVDAFKYLLNLFIINGCSSDEFYNKFIDKSDVVDIRYKQEFELQNIKDSHDKFVVFDIDGVLNNYPDNFVKYFQNQGYNFKNIFEFKQNDNFNYRLLKKKFRETGEERKNIIKQDNVNNILLFFKNKGFKIILLTARPYKKQSRLFSDTIYWLNKNQLTYDFIFFNENKEELLIDTFRNDQIQFIVDDDINNVNKLKDHFDTVYLLKNNNLNIDFDNYSKVKSGIIIIDNLEDLIK